MSRDGLDGWRVGNRDPDPTYKQQMVILINIFPWDGPSGITTTPGGEKKHYFHNFNNQWCNVHPCPNFHENPRKIIFWSKWTNRMMICHIYEYHPFGPKYDFSWILMKICTWMHITSQIMEIVKIVLFFTTRGGGSTVFAVLAAFINFCQCVQNPSIHVCATCA